MKAMILAAGLGVRLGALTSKTPKCLVSVGGKPMLEYVVGQLASAGVEEIVINLHYLPDQIEQYVRSRNSFGLKIYFSREEQILGTGGGLKKAVEHFLKEDSFLLVNSDVFTDLKLSELLDVHSDSGALGTLAVMKREESNYLLFSADDDLVGWERSGGKKEVVIDSTASRPLAFCGIHALSPKIFEFLKEEQGEFSIIQTYLSAARAGEKLKAFDLGDRFWAYMGTLEGLSRLERHLSGQSRSER